MRQSEIGHEEQKKETIELRQVTRGSQSDESGSDENSELSETQKDKSGAELVANSEDESGYGDEEGTLEGGRQTTEKNHLYTLDQFMGDDGLLRDEVQREKEENYKQPQ